MSMHASWRTLIAGTLLGPLFACEPAVSARAVWIDLAAGEGQPTIHVYDQGELREFAVVAGDDPITSMQLDRRGRGLLIRLGEQRGVWIDLADGRRLPLLLPPSQLVGSGLEFAEDGSALLWSDYDAATAIGSLTILPVAPGLALEREQATGVQTLIRPNAVNWWVSASDAPVALVAEVADEGQDADEITLALLRWPDDPEHALVVRELAKATRPGVPSRATRPSTCSFAIGCTTRVALDPDGELAIFGDDDGASWRRFDVRVPNQDAALTLPSALAEALVQSELGLIQVIDRDHSLWQGGGLLYWWDQRTDEVRTLPVALLGEGPFHVVPIERGHAVLFMSVTGPVLRADQDGLRPVSLVTTPCPSLAAPVVSPSGNWLAWSCLEGISEFTVARAAVVRVSALGLDRLGGVTMIPLAIDDDGDLLLTSVVLDSIVFENANSLEGLAAQNVPRNLYVLSREGVLSRIDELEPAPAAVFVGGEFGAYIQAAAF